MLSGMLVGARGNRMPAARVLSDWLQGHEVGAE